MAVARSIRDVIDQLQRDGVRIDADRPRYRMFCPRAQMTQVLATLLPSPVWDKAYDRVAEWLADSGGNGLMLVGNCGTGKTLLAAKVLPILFLRNYGRTLRVFGASEINRREEEVMRCPCKVIDDVGVEDAKRDFGEVRNVFANVVDKAEKCGDTLIITTNLTADEITAKYGERTFDRLRALVRVVGMEGRSKRPSATARKDSERRMA